MKLSLGGGGLSGLHKQMAIKIHGSRSAKLPSQYSSVGNITGRQGLPIGYRKSNVLKASITLHGKKKKAAGGTDLPGGLRKFLRVLP